MNKTSLLLLGVSALALSMMAYAGWAKDQPSNFSSVAVSHTETKADYQRTSAAFQPIPYADTKLRVVEDIDGQRIISVYDIAGDGSWRQEIVEHYAPVAVGVIATWDTKTSYTYEPDGNRLTIDKSNVGAGGRVIPNPILSAVYPSNIKYRAKQAAVQPVSEGDLDVYTEGLARYKISKKDGLIKAVETFDENGVRIGHITVQVVASIKHDKSKFQIDPAGKNVETMK